MSTTGEVENTAVVEEPGEGPLTAEQPQAPAEKKPVEEKKPRERRERKPKAHKTTSHPPYFQMIQEALVALDEKSGSSPYAIAKYMEEKHKAVLPANFRKMLGLQLKNSAARGKLIKIKASYKLSESTKIKKLTAKAEKKPDTAPETKRKAEPEKKKKKNKKTTTKSKLGKKMRRTTAAVAKKPKSIRSPAVKKAAA